MRERHATTLRVQLIYSEGEVCFQHTDRDFCHLPRSLDFLSPFVGDYEIVSDKGARTRLEFVIR
jgi:hypothetical protein